MTLLTIFTKICTCIHFLYKKKFWGPLIRNERKKKNVSSYKRFVLLSYIIKWLSTIHRDFWLGFFLVWSVQHQFSHLLVCIWHNSLIPKWVRYWDGWQALSLTRFHHKPAPWTRLPPELSLSLFQVMQLSSAPCLTSLYFFCRSGHLLEYTEDVQKSPSCEYKLVMQ